jgi:hypothetical protein
MSGATRVWKVMRGEMRRREDFCLFVCLCDVRRDEERDERAELLRDECCDDCDCDADANGGDGDCDANSRSLLRDRRALANSLTRDGRRWGDLCKGE